MYLKSAMILIVLVGADVTGCRTPNDGVIVPGQRVGDCVLQRTKIGSNDKEHDADCGRYRSSDSSVVGLDMMFNKSTGYLIGVGTTDRRYATKDGLRVGDDATELTRSSGKGRKVAFVYQYYQSQSPTDEVLQFGHEPALRFPGVVFALTGNGHIGGIWVGTEENLDSKTCPVDQSTTALIPSVRNECRPSVLPLTPAGGPGPSDGSLPR
jgi:hypothetical protein